MSRDREVGCPDARYQQVSLKQLRDCGLTDAPVENRRKTRRKRPCA